MLAGLVIAGWLLTVCVVTACHALQAAKTAAEVTENAATEANEAANENNALESTSKAAVAAWRASQVQLPRSKALAT